MIEDLVQNDVGQVIGITCNMPFLQIFWFHVFSIWVCNRHSFLKSNVEIYRSTFWPKIHETWILSNGWNGRWWTSGGIICNMFETNQEMVTPWHPPPFPSPFLKKIIVLFVLLSYVLQHYNWEKGTINRFKVWPT